MYCMLLACLLNVNVQRGDPVGPDFVGLNQVTGCCNHPSETSRQRYLPNVWSMLVSPHGVRIEIYVTETAVFLVPLSLLFRSSPPWHDSPLRFGLMSSWRSV